MDEKQIRKGTHAGHYWFTSTEDYSGSILRVCPEVVLNRYLAVTSVDSGVMRPTDAQLTAGWQTRPPIIQLDTTALGRPGSRATTRFELDVAQAEKAGPIGEIDSR